MRIKTSGFLLAAVLLLSVFSNPCVATENAPALKELKASIANILAEYDVPAVSIALIDKSGPIWVGALGKSDLEEDTDANADTLFRIGSTSKMFVSLAILKLIEQGELSLQDKVNGKIPILFGLSICWNIPLAGMTCM